MDIKDYLDYDSLTGLLTWKKQRGRINVGDVVRNIGSNGYIRVQFMGKRYSAHRVAWYLMTGEWPKLDIDHINGEILDNRWSNLREATKLQNQHNKKMSKSNRSGYKGVYLTKRHKYRSRIRVNKKELFLGYYDTPEEAHDAYVTAAIKYFKEFANFG
jgi:hypothetical protein